VSRGGTVGGRRAALEAVRSGRASEVLVATGSRRSPGLRELLEAARAAGVPVRTMPREELDRLVPEHRGVVALAEKVRELAERALATWPFEETALVVVLDGVTDPQNLGAAARSAEAVGAAMLVTRVRRSAPVSAVAMRASAGALLHLPHARVANVTRALARLQDVGFFVVGLDGSADASVYDEPCPPGRVALVVGGEGGGLSRLARERCDTLVALPMAGRVASLNASAALAAVLYAYVVPSRQGAGA
jgi:23S rRNA (guanosine2251-2'-O)-methyltransferase